MKVLEKRENKDNGDKEPKIKCLEDEETEEDRES